MFCFSVKQAMCPRKKKHCLRHINTNGEDLSLHRRQHPQLCPQMFFFFVFVCQIETDVMSKYIPTVLHLAFILRERKKKTRLSRWSQYSYSISLSIYSLNLSLLMERHLKTTSCGLFFLFFFPRHSHLVSPKCR